MSSWTSGVSLKKGVHSLPYYHQCGFSDFASEFFDLCISVTYAQDTKNFLFVLDIMNSVSSEFLYFQNTLKKNMLLRYLPYFPSTGFNLKDRKDLTRPIALQGPVVDKQSVFDLAPLLFTIQDKVRERANQFFERHELGKKEYKAIVCVSPTCLDPIPYLHQLSSVERNDTVALYIVAPSLDIVERFRKAFPPMWTLESIHTTHDLHTSTLEQKINRHYLEVAEFQRLYDAPIVIGSYQDIRCRLLGILSKRFREQFRDFRSIDGKFFSIFPDA